MRLFARLGLPAGGFWKERFNSDVYDHWVNPQVAGNGGGVFAQGRGLHGFAASAEIVIPANSVVCLLRDSGASVIIYCLLLGTYGGQGDGLGKVCQFSCNGLAAAAAMTDQSHEIPQDLRNLVPPAPAPPPPLPPSPPTLPPAPSPLS